MAAKIDIALLAKLAQIKLSPSEAEEITNQLERLIDHIDEIQAVETHGIEPLRTSVELEQVLREDEAKLWEGAEAAIDLAPEISGRLFKVPPVV